MSQINRGKVIEGLKWHIHTTRARECKYALVDCPYVDNCRKDDSARLLMDALELLQEPEEFEPVFHDGACRYTCGNCESTIIFVDGKDDSVRKCIDYCWHCGKRIKWSD